MAYVMFHNLQSSSPYARGQTQHRETHQFSRQPTVPQGPSLQPRAGIHLSRAEQWIPPLDNQSGICKELLHSLRPPNLSSSLKNSDSP